MENDVQEKMLKKLLRKTDLRVFFTNISILKEPYLNKKIEYYSDNLAKIMIRVNLAKEKYDIEILVKNINLHSNEFIDVTKNIDNVLYVIEDNFTVDLNFNVFHKNIFIKHEILNTCDCFDIVYSKQIELPCIYNIPKTLDITCTMSFLFK